MELRFLRKYLKYRLCPNHKNGHGIHSPFVFEFVIRVLENPNRFYCYSSIENLRNNLLSSELSIPFTDYGAGAKYPGETKKRKVSEICKKSVKNKKYAQLLFRIAQFYKPEKILELGTSLGLTTCYFSYCNSKSKVYTIEACEPLHKLSLYHFDLLNRKNIVAINSTFDQALPDLLNQLKTIDMVFIDGNHTHEATLRYFNLILPYTHNNTILVFDDIHWSKGMEEAWELIKNNEKVVATIDLFFLGLVFFRKEMTKENFVIKF